jgi:hypothetical protein
LVVVLDRSVGIALAPVEVAAAKIGVDIFWICRSEPDRLVEVLDGIVGIALAGVIEAATNVGVDIFWICRSLSPA